MSKERYENLDGIRAYACIGIVLMHVLANGGFGLTGFVFEKLIPSFTNFTLLFMLLSAFSLCVGIMRDSKMEQSVWSSSTSGVISEFGRSLPCFVLLN